MTEAEALRILHVARDASPAEIRRAYLDLVKVWHPDRFQSDARLRERAQRTLQEINTAYTLLEHGTTGARAEPNVNTDPVAPAPAGDTLWLGLHPHTVLAIGAGLALGVGLALALIFQSTPAPAADLVTEPTASIAPTDTPSQPATPAPAAAPRPRPATQPPRPDSGTEIGPRGPAGRGALTIRSGLALDGVVELSNEAGQRRRIYLRRGEQITLLDLVPGVYQLRFAAGTGWTGRWFIDTPATVERIRPVTVAQSVPGVPVESVTLVFGDPSLRSTSLLVPD